MRGALTREGRAGADRGPGTGSGLKSVRSRMAYFLSHADLEMWSNAALSGLGGTPAWIAVHDRHHRKRRDGGKKCQTEDGHSWIHADSAISPNTS